MNEHELIELANAIMPFGKYKGKLIKDIPENYLIWLNGQEYVNGKLSQQLLLMADLKLNGLETLLTPLVKVNYLIND